tara:strand:+ start:2634 stop:3659 length:1026 start_codon:yes stop_codon:yes gene_type:complete
MDIKEAISTVVSGRSLSIEDASSVMNAIMEGETSPSQLGAFLTGLHLKRETPSEIAGMANVMREKALHVHVDNELADTCGTGGDGKNTFNISTAAAFVAASCNINVAKHGNRAASGSCGSADVLEALGVKIDLEPSDVEKCITEVGMGFMFAPVFHPSMKYAGPVRREIGIPTVFNVLGPLTNPAKAQYQLLGVGRPELGQTMADALNLQGISHALVVHGEDGIDELTLSGNTKVWEVNQGKVESWSLAISDTGLSPASVDSIKGGTADENANKMKDIFGGEDGPIKDVIALNTGAVLYASNRADTIQAGIEIALEKINDGSALRKISDLVSLSQELGRKE